MIRGQVGNLWPAAVQQSADGLAHRLANYPVPCTNSSHAPSHYTLLAPRPSHFIIAPKKTKFWSDAAMSRPTESGADGTDIGHGRPWLVFGFGYLVGRAPKLGHRTDGLWCVNNLPKVVT